MYQVTRHFIRHLPLVSEGARPLRGGRPGRGRAAGFSLVELVVVIAVIAIVIGLATVAFSSATEGAKMAGARNTLVTFAQLARSYAIANEIETMMVVNPYSNRLELWHLNPPESPGTWDPKSEYDPPAGVPVDPNLINNSRQADGYAFAGVFDSGAQLPDDVAVHPIDFYDDLSGTESRFRDVDERYMDNLTWAAFCFDSSGRMVIRERRIATRSYRMRDGTLRGNPNRLPDGQPDLSIIGIPTLPSEFQYLVWGIGNQGDSLIRSTYGFVLSDADKMERFVGDNPTPQQLVDDWLRLTYDDTIYDNETDDIRDYTPTIILNRFSGQELADASAVRRGG